jgi:hypothetical protein
MAQRCQFTPGPGGSVHDASAGDQAVASRNKVKKDKPPVRTKIIPLDSGIRSNKTMSVPNWTDPCRPIAVARLETPTAKVKAPWLKSIAIPPGTSKELYFVAVVRGEYDLECTAPLHALFGMVGKISIE